MQLQDCHPIQDMNYYNQAMNLIKSDKYMIFSDDIPLCKTKFIGDQFIFAEGNSNIEDLALQASCDNNIICNSSFSWWAGFLNKNPNKKVIYPSKWFGVKLPHNTNDMCPPEWIKI